ncbi:sigma-54-dependent transcriptional regulator [Devosia lacusdianchii]|uniref:sigma-54-dependent transcriptional regulator n=1 Tax=Devosia lacusdianchii TaxID=2917991 RepID=UPI001F0528D0|nr:sigma-54 dependent transcriptional regulator [Devosia sp. JXJ CY 41]
MTRGTIAFVDDEPRLCDAAAEWLGVNGFTVQTFTDPQRAVRDIDTANCDCVVTDLRMPGTDGQQLLRHLRSIDTDMPVILLTGHGDVAAAVAAMREGAHDFIEKPYDADHLVAVLDRAVERRRLGRELQRLRARADVSKLESRLVGNSPAMISLRRTLEQLAAIDVDVLLQGETGTGKEVAARALHDLGPRSKGAFVAINCAAIPEAMFESEIFGHARGAFTGAIAERIGRIPFANGGTVFLDEIESMPLALQGKVLRVIQERTVEPLGGNRSNSIDVRFVAATKVDLKVASEAGDFRADLYFRLATVEVSLPALRDRPSDIPLLFSMFCEEAALRFGLPQPELGAEAMQELQMRPWSGNVRELKAVADRHVLRHQNRTFAEETNAIGVAGTLPERLARFEADAIMQALRGAGGSTTKAAEALGLPRRTLAEKIARYGLRVTQE